MALFLAGLRSVDQDLIKAAQIDGAGDVPHLPQGRPARRSGRSSSPWWWCCCSSRSRPSTSSSALTGGGPGIATTFPAIYVYDLMFQRGQIGEGAAAAIMILLALAVVLVPYSLWPRLAPPPGGRRWLTPIARSTIPLAAGGAAALRRAAASSSTACWRSSPLIYLLPLVVVVLNSFRDLPEIAAQRPDRLAAQLLASTPGHEAWSTYCIGGTCEGMQRNFFNSLWMTIPATIISTALGAMNGYILSKWRFRGSEVAVRLHDCSACSCPGQIALMPWAFILGNLGLTNTTAGLVLVHASRASPSPRCSAATTTSTSPTT